MSMSSLDVQKYSKYEYYCVIAYSGVKDDKIVSGFINPKLGRFICTNTIQWGTYDMKEAISIAAMYSYQASKTNEFSVYKYHIVYGIMPNVEFYYIG